MAIIYLDEAPTSSVTYLDEPQPKSRFRENVSRFAIHPLIEGGAMGIGGTAAGILASPGGPLASALAGPAGAIAIYPPAHQAANAIDRLLGLNPEEPSLPESLKQGVAMETTGRALPVVAEAAKKIPFAKYAEGLTGSPAQNFRRMFAKGLPAYSASSLEEAGAKFGAEKFKLMGETLTPEEQVKMVTNPNGAATKKLTDVMTQWLKGKTISGKDALMARQAADTIFPADTAKQASRRGALTDFKNAMNNILSKRASGMKVASDEYAGAKLKSQMLQPFRVNKSNPDEPSKLALMLGIPGGGLLTAHGDFGKAISYFASQSPAFMGFVSALSGSLSKLLPKLSLGSQEALARGLFSAFQQQNGNQ